MDAQAIIEDYVNKVAAKLPRKLRNDVGLELRTLLTEQLRPQRRTPHGCPTARWRWTCCAVSVRRMKWRLATRLAAFNSSSPSTPRFRQAGRSLCRRSVGDHVACSSFPHA